MKLRNVLLMLIGVAGMGVSLSFLLGVGYGTDTSSFMNSSVAMRTGLSLGIVMVSMNAVQLVAELVWGRHYIGLGTLVNMTAIGFISDFCTYLSSLYVPQYLFHVQPYRTLIFIPSLVFFLLSAALYMNSDTGLAPFDAIPMIVSGKVPLPFFAVRMAWDFLAIAIGLIAGGRLTIGTIIMAFTVGPAVSWIGKLMRGRAV